MKSRTRRKTLLAVLNLAVRYVCYLPYCDLQYAIIMSDWKADTYQLDVRVRDINEMR